MTAFPKKNENLLTLRARAERRISSHTAMEETLRDAHEKLEAEVRKQTRELVHANALLKSQIVEQKLNEQVLEHTKDMLRELGAHQERLKEDERKRIARELHDELGGLLTCIKAHLSVTQVRMLRAGLPEEPGLVTAATLVNSAVLAMSRVVTDLRPSVLDQLGVWAALEWYADQFKEADGLRCTFEIDEAAAATEIDAERSTALYRIVQEAMTNAVRHSGASQVLIRVVLDNNALTVEVQDNGKGIATERRLDRKSFGIAGMRERALRFGGKLTVSGGPGKGTLLALELPLGVRHESPA